MASWLPFQVRPQLTISRKGSCGGDQSLSLSRNATEKDPVAREACAPLHVREHLEGSGNGFLLVRGEALSRGGWPCDRGRLFGCLDRTPRLARLTGATGRLETRRGAGAVRDKPRADRYRKDRSHERDDDGGSHDFTDYGHAAGSVTFTVVSSLDSAPKASTASAVKIVGPAVLIGT